ncbi:MAG: hypothetical protein GU362_05765 [Thaumarchaeota archaeon]|jgi:hypothetical protein|nr:hypothetical protein [Nitrososphaerota archaeon]
MIIAVFDNDVLVDIFDRVYYLDRRKFKEVINYLSLSYSKIWIPKSVKGEFLQGKKRKKMYYRLLKRYNNLIKDCPITISKNEINLLLSPEIHLGEADGISQIRKAETLPSYKYLKKFELIFVSNDKKAINFAEKRMNVKVKTYNEIKDSLREEGIII